MLVKERMSHPVITVHPEMPIQEAHWLMQKERVRRFPVVDKRGRLVGIVSEIDILHASPSDATSLSIWEVNYLFSKIIVKNVMTQNIITISTDTPIEEAARIMADNKIGGLPVVRDGEVVGIITETDLFKIFLELMGARDPGIRLSALVPNVPGELFRLSKAIYDIGGNVVAMGTFLGESSENREIVIKVEGISTQSLRESIEPFVERIMDVRESTLR
ncbi:MAG: CBS and ACT domain-containing protein [Chloroflexota bacterium]|nr:CBS and ACT domain-containing protein [Chloroflexota bacterium]